MTSCQSSSDEAHHRTAKETPSDDTDDTGVRNGTLNMDTRMCCQDTDRSEDQTQDDLLFKCFFMFKNSFTEEFQSR